MQTSNRDNLGRNNYWTPSNISLTQSLINEAINEINLKVGEADVYNKNEIDSKISNLNVELEKKANKADVYNKNEIDNKLSTISKNIEVYPTINLLDLLDSTVSTQTSFVAYSPQRLFMVNIPAESNITLWYLKFVLFIDSTTTDKERLKELMMNLRLSVYIGSDHHHELSVKPQYFNDNTRYYIDSTFILNSLPTSDITLYIDALTSISMNDLEIKFNSSYSNYIYRIGLST